MAFEGLEYYDKQYTKDEELEAELLEKFILKHAPTVAVAIIGMGTNTPFAEMKFKTNHQLNQEVIKFLKELYVDIKSERKNFFYNLFENVKEEKKFKFKINKDIFFFNKHVISFQDLIDIYFKNNVTIYNKEEIKKIKYKMREPDGSWKVGFITNGDNIWLNRCIVDFTIKDEYDWEFEESLR